MNYNNPLTWPELSPVFPLQSNYTFTFELCGEPMEATYMSPGEEFAAEFLRAYYPDAENVTLADVRLAR